MRLNRGLKRYRRASSGCARRVPLALLRAIEAFPSRRAFLAGAGATLAHGAGYDGLGACPDVRRRVGRVETVPRFVGFRKTPAGLGAGRA